ncbi:unnamed protein product [Closterium sp. NIES-64]|nr:unnamed protein product [Closterium sp. NIES-64]
MSNVAPPSPTFPPFPPPAPDGGVGAAGVVRGVPLDAPPGDGEEGWAEGAEGEAEGGAAGEAEGGAEGEAEAGAEAGVKGAEDAGAEAEGSAPRVVVIGLESGRSNVNPWSKGLLDLKMPAVRPGDFLLFRWFGQMRDVQQFPNKQAFDSCDFSRADPAGGADVITVVSAGEGAEEEDESLQRLRALRQVVGGERSAAAAAHPFAPSSSPHRATAASGEEQMAAHVQRIVRDLKDQSAASAAVLAGYEQWHADVAGRVCGNQQELMSRMEAVEALAGKVYKRMNWTSSVVKSNLQHLRAGKYFVLY